MKKSIKNLLLILLFIPCFSILSACADSSENNPQPTGEEITGVTFSSQTFDYDGTEKELKIDGTLPEGVTVVYTSNKGTNAGVYNAQAVLSGEGFITKTLTANLTINKLNYDMSGVSWNYSEAFGYDGTEKTVELTGLPSGVTVKQYIDNSKINAGDYSASATFDYDEVNYNEPIAPKCDWTINKATISGVTFTDKTVTYDGSEQSVLVSGVLPEGVTAQYTSNKGTEVGTYNAQVTLSGINYATLTLNATLKINPNVAQIAQNVIDSIAKMPEPWSFLPESFSLAEKNYTGPSVIDFNSGFVNVSQIPQTGIGKQMNVIYSTLISFDKYLSYLRTFYGSLSVVTNLYQDFINNNPNNYATFEKNTDNFDFKITMTDESYELLVDFSAVAIELSYNCSTKKCFGRIQATDSNVIKYEIGEDSLKVAVNLLNLSLTQIEFVRQNDVVCGYLYEYVGTETKNLKTSALIRIDDKYTSIISNKRETDDLKIEGCVEMYDNQTAKFIGSEIKETVSAVQFDTMWFNLSDISAINSIKKVDELNGVNLDTIYVNGSSNKFEAKKVGGVSLKLASRRFDIEMKEMFFYKFDESTQKYEKISIEIPMMFIQKEFVDSFSDDMTSTNSKNGITSTANVSLPNSEFNYLNAVYSVLLDTYTSIKSQVEYADIKNYVGQKNPFFVD